MASEIDELHSSLTSIRDDIDRLTVHISDDVTQNTAAITSGLHTALSWLQKLADFIRGDFDKQPHDAKQKMDLLKALTNSCDHVHTLTRMFLRTVGNEHTTAVELRQTRVVPLTERITTATATVRTAIEGLDAQIQTTNQTVQQERQVLANNADSLDSLSRKLAEAEEINNGVDIGVSILIPIWGIINAIDHSKGPGSIGPLRDMVNSARSAVSKARETLDSTQNTLRRLEDDRHRLLDLQRLQASAAAELPGLATFAEASIQRINKIEAGLIAAEKTTTESVRRAGRLSNAAELTAALAISKKEFAEGILDVLETLVMDSTTALAARSVLDTLAQGYSGTGMPKTVQDRSGAIEDKLAQLPASH